MSDEQLADLLKRNRREGFRLTYEKYADRLLAVCRWYSVNGRDAVDLLHEAMLKFYDKSGSFVYQGEGSLYRWLKRLTVNMILDKNKWKRRHRVECLQDLSSEVMDTDDALPFELTADDIHKIMDTLSPQKRQVFNLYYLEGYSHKEIGDLLGISENGSSSFLSKVRRELAEKVRKNINENK